LKLANKCASDPSIFSRFIFDVIVKIPKILLYHNRLIEYLSYQKSTKEIITFTLILDMLVILMEQSLKKLIVIIGLYAHPLNQKFLKEKLIHSSHIY
jgi:hypothetical protein